MHWPQGQKVTVRAGVSLHVDMTDLVFFLLLILYYDYSKIISVGRVLHVAGGCDALTCIVYADGRVCISILHAPGDDPMGYESSSERWSPVQSVEKILLSVVSMLAGTSPHIYNPNTYWVARNYCQVFLTRFRLVVRLSFC